jgi:hypothetical protein
MESGQAAGHVGEGSTEAVTVVDVVELRPVGELLVCASCLVSNSAADAFCTACGSPLRPVVTAEDDRSAEPPYEVSDIVRTGWLDADVAPSVTQTTQVLAPEPMTASRSRRWPLLLAVLLGVAALAAAVIFGLLWRSATSHASHTEAKLDVSQANLRTTAAALRDTSAKLAAVTSLSDRRKAVLLQAQDVLAKVDPLLSSVDDIQGKATAIQAQRDIFTGDSDTLTQTMITLGNYVIQTDPAYIDQTYLQQLIDSANSELATVRTDEANLSGSDSGYTTASSGFGNKANAFSASVRSLQKQLKTTAGG